MIVEAFFNLNDSIILTETASGHPPPWYPCVSDPRKATQWHLQAMHSTAHQPPALFSMALQPSSCHGMREVSEHVLYSQLFQGGENRTPKSTDENKTHPDLFPPILKPINVRVMYRQISLRRAEASQRACRHTHRCTLPPSRTQP